MGSKESNPTNKDSIYHMTLRLLWNLISAAKKLKFCHYVRNVVMDVTMFPENLLTTSGLSILLYGVISLPDATSYDKKFYTLLKTVKIQINWLLMKPADLNPHCFSYIQLKHSDLGPYCLLQRLSNYNSRRRSRQLAVNGNEHLFDLMLYVQVNSVSVTLGRVFLGWTKPKQPIKCLA